MLDEEEVEAAAARLNELVVENGYHIDCGILGNKYIYRALSDFGYGETLYRMVTNPTCPSYAWWMDQGMTTLCEDWEMTISLNHHMYSEVDLWFYRYLAGIQLDEDRLTIAPQCLPQLEWSKPRAAGSRSTGIKRRSRSRHPSRPSSASTARTACSCPAPTPSPGSPSNRQTPKPRRDTPAGLFPPFSKLQSPLDIFCKVYYTKIAK